MKKLALFIIVAVFLMTGTAVAEHKAGWSPKCKFHSQVYCNNCSKESLDECLKQ